MLWPWPELVLPRGKEGSEGLIPLVSDFVRQSRWQQKCRHNIPSMRDFCAFVLKEINFSRSLLKYEEVGFCRKGQHSGHVACSHQPGLLLTSLPLALPHTSGRTCDNDWGLVCQGRLRDLKKKRFMCIAPNHVLLVINLGYPRILSSLIYVHISQAFVERRSIGSHLVHPGG